MKSKINRSDYRKFAAWILTIAMTFSLSGFGVTYAQTGSGETATGSDALPAEEDGSFPDGTVGVDTEATDSDATASDAFHAEETVDGIKIILDAPEGVFPKGAVLSAKKITEAGKLSDIREGISETKKEEGETAPETGNSVTLDISILDADGNEIEPDTSKGKVNVRFEEVSGTGLEVWHIPDAGKAEKMDTEVTKNKTDGKAAIAFEAETFSAYTITFDAGVSTGYTVTWDKDQKKFIIDGGTSETDYSYDTSNSDQQLLTIKSNTPVTISRGTSGSPIRTARIEIADGVSANVTLSNLNISCELDSPFKIADNSTGNVNITLAGENSLVSTNDAGAGLQKSGDGSSGTLTIAGSGSLTATGGEYGAGIGGGGYGAGSNITISGGIVTATGGSSDNRGGAGIGGGGGYGAGSNITISGGIVTATGGSGGGAGIGGGCYGAGSNITISGGIVTATGGGGGGAGIGGGGGGYYGAGSNITISGGTVTAKGGDYRGTGIGGGYGGAGSDITISGGSVNASSISGTPKEATTDDARPVYLATLTVQNSSGTAASDTLFSSLGNSDHTALKYGTKDMQTDTDGKLYVYLPEGTDIAYLQDSSGTEYACTAAAGKIIVNNTGTQKEIYKQLTLSSTGESSSGESYTQQWGQNGNNWTYRKSNGQYAQNEWQQISYNGETSWYYFGSDSGMVSGWYRDDAGNWYYLKESSGTSETGTGSGGGSYKGAMQTGWITDPQDEHRYYLDLSTGKMVTGLKEIDGLLCYFNETVPEQSGWSRSETENKLVYKDNGALPLGACMEPF